MKYYLIAGEASGDLHGSNLMKELKAKDPQASFRFFGGDLMLSQGGELAKHYKDMAYMGFVEVLANIRSIFRNISDCKNDLLAYRPDVLVLIDFPGFNLRIAEFAKKNNIKVCYYISPKIWAWNQKRVFKIKKYVDQMLCILPFETEFYRQWDYEAHYVGNPLMDAIEAFHIQPDFLSKNNLSEKPVIAVLPGSRKQEITKILPEMVLVSKKFPNHQFVIAGAPNFNMDYYQQWIADTNIRIVFNQTYDLLTKAQAALVTSGTATLETALLNIPQVVCYKANALSVSIARLLIKVKFISLVNLIADKAIVKELIQDDCNVKEISEELDLVLNNTHYRRNMLENYKYLQEQVGKGGASARAADFIFSFIHS